MDESRSDFNSSRSMAFQFLQLAGYPEAQNLSADASDSDMLYCGLSWCIFTVKSAGRQLDLVPIKFFDQFGKIENAMDIEAAMSLMECPHPVRAAQIEKCDFDGISPALEWITSIVKSAQEDALERQEVELQSQVNVQHSRLLAEIKELEETKSSCDNDLDICGSLDDSIRDNLKRLNLKKMELAENLRKMVYLRRQLDELPIQSELIQYERRFSELNTHIQEKFQQTQKHYATCNALLEIKDLMLKEMSLLNSISSQFQDAITTTAGRAKLIDSMEALHKSTQQKLRKVQSSLEEEQRVCESLRLKYAAALTDRRRCSALLKSLQEECARNETLKSQMPFSQHS